MESASFVSSSASEVSLISARSWLKKQLGSCASIKARIGWQGLTTKEYLNSGDYYLITGTDFFDGRIDWKNCHYVTKARFDQDPHIKIQKGDVLVSKDGTIGKVAFLDDIPGPGTLNSGVFVIRSKDKQVSQRYLAKVFVSKYFDDFIDSIVAGSTIVHLYQKDIVNFSFYVPPTIEEQDRIADVLESIDNLLVRLDEAIAKKRQIKEGLMQQLLTGKTRLPGFRDEWEELELGSILSYEQPGPFLVHNTDYVESGVPVLTAGKTFILGYTNENFGIYTNLPVIIFDDFVTESKYVDFPFKAKSSAMKMLSVRDKDRHNIRFIYDVMQQIDFPMTDHKRWWIAEYSHLKVRVPASIDEENAIAKAFSTIDGEIHSFEAQREKYTRIKQGMMQELLTGKTRLI